MALRCLIFSSNEEMVKPIRQVLTELGIEGEYCKNAVDAVERVTTQLFQIVITDWEDQPEATFLLKTARDLKAAQRPLTLAIVSDDARPQALQAGANSVLLKPIRAEQVRDTMSTACELLRAKFQPGAPATPREAPKTAVMAAAASTAGISVPASVIQAPEKIRAGEFLQSSNSAPGAQFDTEKEVHESLEAPVEEVDALTELEPTAAAVQEIPEQKSQPQSEPQEALTGWAALQARLTKSAPRVTEDAPVREEATARNELPIREGVPSHGGPAATEKLEAPGERQAKAESQSEAALHAYMAGELRDRPDDPQQERPKRGKVLVLSALAVVSMALAAVPRTRQELQTLFHSTVRATVRLLNPPDAPLPQAVAQHDSFGQSGDEYKLPAAGNIPGATTDPSQIRVVPVIDPTAKSEKGAGANSGQTELTTGENSPADQPSAGHSATDHSPTDQAPTGQAASDQSQPVPAPSSQTEASPAADPTVNIRNMPGTAKPELPTTAPAAPPVNQNAPAMQVVPPVRASTPVSPHTVLPGGSAGIPSSLKSQLASSTPEASGAKPVESAMSSIEPVNLPETAVRELLAQPVDPEYPAAAKASGQGGSVVLQVLIGRDGTVQDAKFLQGSLIFARAAIDAVRQWRFKPYSMNGRAVSVQSLITLNFKPPA